MPPARHRDIQEHQIDLALGAGSGRGRRVRDAVTSDGAKTFHNAELRQLFTESRKTGG